MTIPRVKPAGWAVNEKLSSGQMNALDTQINTRAFDKQAGQNETVASNPTFTGTSSFRGPTTIDSAGGGTLTMGGTARVLLASRSITRFLTNEGVVDLNTGAPTGGTWIWPGTFGGWAQNVINTAELHIPLRLPHGCVLQTVTARFIGAGGHGALPGSMPTLKVYRYADGAHTQLGSTGTDASASVVAYEAWHDISVTTIAHTVDRALYRYYARLKGETGGNNVVGSVFGAVKYTADFTAYDED